MATYHFYLKNNNPDKESPIILAIRFSKKRTNFYTREDILPKYWDTKAQRVKQTGKFPEYPEFNQRLNNIKATARDVFRRYQNDHNHNAPSHAEYLELLKAAIKGIQSGIPVTLIEFTEYFIDQTRKKLEIEKRTISRGNIAGSYNQTLTCLKDFAKDKNRRIDFDTIDPDFYTDFIKYLETPKVITDDKGKQIKKYGFRSNTIGKHIKNLKRILNEASTPEMNVNKFTFYKRFKVQIVEIEAIYLSEKELQTMYELDLSDSPRLDRVRDLFLVGAWTGLRFSDFTNIQEKNIKGDFIHIATQKTGQKVVIPLHPVVKAIMEKYKDRYENSLPPAISNVKMNAYLKDIGKKLDILKTPESITIIKAGQKIHTKRMKWELLSTHTARRSFATNMYKAGVPTITIMAITGHRTEKAFLSYIKVTPDEHAKILMKHYQESVKLMVV
ncbi:MAG: site-specific integrase [Bacteroidales bacterium]|nr:site-specific integrase [Bacteroidales bacterium]